ncbi:MAG: hypothetical protein A2268_11975 [Candidatus Raymondbacteria bacterium RifOxyA12_full_50_37]|uniref:Polymerase nucleotidyl transferase domain-containing protein n=1 Tax=Candidatus Raymondbacteria bacterium RIFOXYD12_FULL_49_13 TaxID=1817890 RepID=A0A1F7FGH8_UNCRA|nr:MAG: hypothetical protein A2268_11975 [Candidatus Raymondbacteria bacterium RifOxyA12_full_50_37]OGJ91700.1 MAG: hypothetical protein A2248_08040 [Candidatus Raymondbacteria bacterium RIFOXYA2_FULL_49_16]OGJ98711.1 MAG: hypothetical protein A2453_08205 [Candidatus Raymondbacteria bacterium RIFOXYC2_FULL_50_21]OGK01524.1 MAG: hypothetical protein A2487_13370 [Candidatus Raymondbacteria bacterium RifOxyC12_full_50_8]OGK02200.1 MAG: hypothetical protein A2350_20265 [Candidatus Raymondbacteria b
MSKKALFKRISTRLKNMGANKVGIFGSYARGEDNKKSDIDVLVHFKNRKSLLQMVEIEQALSEELGIKVDLLTEQAISPYLIDRIKKETIPV